MRTQTQKPTRAQLDDQLRTMMTREIQLMTQAIDGYARKVRKPEVADMLIRDCKYRLFKAYTTLGQWGNAKQVALDFADKAMNDEVSDLVLAEQRDDKEVCSCTNDVRFIGGGQVEIPRFMKWRRIFSEKHARFVNVYLCTKCGFTNSAPFFEPTRAIDSAREARLQKSDDEVLQ